jgi:hypothetical protein
VREDRYTNTPEDAAEYERVHEFEPDDRERPSAAERDDDLECTHCGGEGTCDDGADPLWSCPDELHSCHACGGSGNRKDQRVF